ncbi:MAG TPA: 2Fe-2S iron-sulfur cluster binding domain-containing protein [Porticoccus sp.]|nr:2Fe-2S iron-sulfur cluster binding domain-containing protein [Porticoccus sp.]
MTTIDIESPFHRGEQDIQSRLGVREQVEELGQRFIRDHMPEQQRAFYAQLPYLLIGTVDDAGRPWASILAGRPGFVHTPDPYTLSIEARPIFGDPLNDTLSEGLQVGLLGIEYQSRRRNRMTGKVAALDDKYIDIKVDQTFGNCPQYIQARDYELLPDIDSIGEDRPVHRIKRLSDRAREIISLADNFYIATHYAGGSDDVTCGADVSHRGGKPGFVRIEDDQTLMFPDFKGNNHFNTLGNILLNPRAGLLFIDFNSGDLVYLTCTAEIIWDSEQGHAFAGAERLVKLTLDEGLLIERAIPIRWNFLEYSPSLEKTGSWAEVAETLAERIKGNVYRHYRVARVEPESTVITSFYLEPADDEKIHCHKAGQFLPIELHLPDADKPIQRTYTISNAPNGEYYRLSIKREPPAKPGLPAGASSNYFHDQVKVGSTIRAMSPRGKFVLDEPSTRPVVLISGGVGITPMMSMLEELANESIGCGCNNRQVWFVHTSRNSQLHAFEKDVRDLAKKWPCLHVHFCHSKPLATDVEGEDYDSLGHIDIELIKSLLPFDDHEFYICGPAPFMTSLYDGLKGLNVSHERIHYEFFGSGASLHHDRPSGFKSLTEELGDRGPVAVRLARSGIEARWDPSQGTLLDFAEAHGLQPAYSCRSGICQTCVTKILEGAVQYTEPPMTPPPEGQALICCSYPVPPRSSDEEAGPLVLDL